MIYEFRSESGFSIFVIGSNSCVLTRNDPIQRRNGIIHANIPEFMVEGEMF